MPHIDKHAPGTFCWVELYTSDQPAAKNFYGSLFGWDAKDSPIGPNMVYTIFQLEGRDAAAGFGMPVEELAKHGGPHWNLYIAVESADDAAARATSLGGKVIAGPFDVQDAGRMAFIQDPTGAIFAVWQPNKNQGIGIASQNGALCWVDLSTSDRITAKKFYEQLFGWKIVPGKDKSEDTYLHIGNNDQRFFAGILPETHRNPNAPPHWLPYFLVADADGVTTKAIALGGQALVPPMDVEGQLRFSVLADPQGAVFAVVRFGQ